MLADCIEGGDETGIIYSFNGVCHQMANRILTAASIKIPPITSDIRFSYFLYTEYGRYDSARWKQRQLLCAQGAGSGSAGPDHQSPRFNSNFRSGSSGLMDFTPESESDDERIASISQLVKAGLGHSVAPDILQRLAKMQLQLQRRQMELAQQALSDKISREQYVHDLDAAMHQASLLGERVMGFDDFHKVFGEFRVQNLFDPQAFIAEDRGAR